jgi:hypothetical protein
MPSLMQQLYDSEINFEVSCFYDGGFGVQLGDALNGFVAQGKVDTWAEVEAWLREQVLAHFPESDFAKGRAPAVDRVVKEMARPRPITKTDK